MPTVQLSFSALPAHVRTARLVAAAVARRAGVGEAALDEVRLAVGEACSRAVELHRTFCPAESVTVRMCDDSSRFEVTVLDRAPAEGDAAASSVEALERASGDDSGEPLPASVGLAVITGLVDDVTVETGQHGSVVRMTWPAVPGTLD